MQSKLMDELRMRELDDGGSKKLLVDRLWAAVCADRVRTHLPMCLGVLCPVSGVLSSGLGPYICVD